MSDTTKDDKLDLRDTYREFIEMALTDVEDEQSLKAIYCVVRRVLAKEKQEKQQGRISLPRA